MEPKQHDILVVIALNLSKLYESHLSSLCLPLQHQGLRLGKKKATPRGHYREQDIGDTRINRGRMEMGIEQILQRQVMNTARRKSLLGRQYFHGKLAALQTAGEGAKPGFKFGELLRQNGQ